MDPDAFDDFVEEWFDRDLPKWMTGDETAWERQQQQVQLRQWALDHGTLLRGEGSERTVFALNGGALKVPWSRESRDGFTSNRHEAKVWRHTPKRLRRLLVPVLAAGVHWLCVLV